MLVVFCYAIPCVYAGKVLHSKRLTPGGRIITPIAYVLYDTWSVSYAYTVQVLYFFVLYVSLRMVYFIIIELR